MSEKNKGNKTGGASKIIIILLVLLIVLLGAFGGYILFFGGASKLHQASTSSNTNNTASPVTTTSADENTYSLDEAIVNLSDTDSQRYLKVKVSFGYDEKNSKLKAELESEDVNKKPILSDAVNSVLRSKKASDFTGNEKSINDMKQQILDAVNPVLKKGKISHIYFDELVVQ